MNAPEVIGRDKELWVPEWLEGGPNPPGHEGDPEDRRVHVNTVPGEVEVADEATMVREIEKHGRITEEPEIGRARDLGLMPAPEDDDRVSASGYMDTYPTHFDWRADVKKFVVRIQKLFPWATFANTYRYHPPVYGRKYEFVSFDIWQGGLNAAGRYLGYRGKPLDPALGTRVFNAIFNDPYAPPIYWIIYRGRMWTRGYGWGPAPAGPPDSDPLHNWHIHQSSLVVY